MNDFFLRIKGLVRKDEPLSRGVAYEVRVVESEVGAGTRFAVRFPIGQPVASEEKSAPAPPPPRRARVLVIDDEPKVRAVLGELLAAHGYTVTQASDGAEGLARCEAEPVVASDVLGLVAQSLGGTGGN